MLTAFSYTQGYKDHFFRTPGGQRLGIHGAEEQRLAFYLLTNPCFDISGDYRLPLKVIAAEIGLKRKALKDLFLKLSDCNFCSYHFRKQRVQIPGVTQVFTQLFNEREDLDPALRCQPSAQPFINQKQEDRDGTLQQN